MMRAGGRGYGTITPGDRAVRPRRRCFLSSAVRLSPARNSGLGPAACVAPVIAPGARAAVIVARASVRRAFPVIGDLLVGVFVPEINRPRDACPLGRVPSRLEQLLKFN